MEGNKRRAEVAKTLVIMSSGLLVGIAAVVGIMPREPLVSSAVRHVPPVIFSILSGFAFDAAHRCADRPGRQPRKVGRPVLLGFLAGLAVMTWGIPAAERWCRAGQRGSAP